MSTEGTEKIVVVWNTRDRSIRRRIRERFGIPDHTSLNWETEARIRAEDMPLLEETARRGFITLRRRPPTGRRDAP